MVSSLGKLISALSATPRRVLLASLAATVLFGLFDFDIFYAVIETDLSSELKAALQATLVGTGAGFALWLILGGVLQRKRQITEELDRVAELNHTIRNSLEIIVLAHHCEVNQEHRALILDCTHRIDLKLKELFPAAEYSRLVSKP